MKRIITILLSLAAAGIFAQSNIQQPLSVNGDGAAPAASAQLDVSATDKGVLVPRMTTAQRTAIASPATGLLVYDTDLPGFWVFNGTIWVEVSKTYVAGTGINVAGTTISNTGDTNAADDITTATAAGGDLTGTYPNPTVGANAIGSAEVTDASITAADLAAGVIPTTLPPSGAAGGDLTGTYPNPTVGANAIGSSEITDASIGAADLAPGVIPTSLPPSGAAGGDLTGTYPNPTVGANAIGSAEITNASITVADLNFGAAAANQVLTATGATTAAWQAPAVPKVMADTDNDTKIQVEESPDEDIIRFDLGGTENMVLRKNANGSPRLELLSPSPNTFVGTNAGLSNTTGTNNTATGYNALKSNTNGNGNTATGYNALYTNNGGYWNTANGVSALYSNTSGYANTANGLDALYSNIDGRDNTASGHRALYYNTSGESNTAIGVQALEDNTSGTYNTATGFQALQNNITSWANAAFGTRALQNNTATLNTAAGYYALIANTSGTQNTAVGASALSANSTGTNNTAVGTNASEFTTGSFNTHLGSYAFYSTGGLNNTTCIGFDAGGVSNVSNRIEIGNTSVSWIGGQVGWSTYSDARIKTQVQENVPGLSFITKLRPVTYHLDIHKQNEMCFRGKKDLGEWSSMYDIEQKKFTGFLAQEVEQAAKAVGYDFSGVERAADEVGMYSVRYAEFVVPLVKAVQEQQTIIQSQNEKIAAQQLEIDRLKKLETQLNNITAALAGAGIVVEK